MVGEEIAIGRARVLHAERAFALKKSANVPNYVE